MGKISKIILYVIAAACIIGLYAYKGSQVHERDLNRQVQEYQRIESSRKIDEINKKRSKKNNCNKNSKTMPTTQNTK